MTREQASDVLDDYDVNFAGHTAEEVAEAFDVAFKVLEQEPCDDAISREGALMALTGEYTESPIEILSKAIKRINTLPPVKPEQKTGKWKKVTAENKDGSISWWYACSECGVPCPKTDHGTDYFGNYCSDCGCRMFDPQEREK